MWRKNRNVDHLVDIEVFDCMKTLVEHAPTTKDLKRTIEDINKANDGAAHTRQIFFGKLILTKILEVHFYTSKCIAINKIPDIRLIDINDAVQFMSIMKKQ